MASAVETTPQPRFAKEAARMTGRTLAAVALGAGALGACAAPWYVDFQKSQEIVHATTARANMQQAILDLTGFRLVSNTTDKAILLQSYSDVDNFAVKAAEPDPAKAQAGVTAAFEELDGTRINQAAADSIRAIGQDGELEVNEMIDASNAIDVSIVNGDMITGRNLAIGAGLIGLAVAGFYGVARLSKPE